MQGLIGQARRIFVRGVLLILPLAMTFVILRWLFRLVTGFSTPGARKLLDSLGTPPAIISVLAPLIAMIVTVAVILLVGLLGGNYAGKRVWSSIENLLLRVPLVSWFYSSARQLMDAIKYSGRTAFREVVLVEYPRRGIWCVGFVTGRADGLVAWNDDEEHLYVFIPTTPNPTSGYTIIVPRAQARTLGLTVEESLKLIFSGGFISSSGTASPRSGAAENPVGP
ncbi:MAG: DUF502 domain-containing protein [Acidobacteriota bacterium]